MGRLVFFIIGSIGFVVGMIYSIDPLSGGCGALALIQLYHIVKLKAVG